MAGVPASGRGREVLGQTEDEEELLVLLEPESPEPLEPPEPLELLEPLSLLDEPELSELEPELDDDEVDELDERLSFL